MCQKVVLDNSLNVCVDKLKLHLVMEICSIQVFMDYATHVIFRCFLLVYLFDYHIN